MIQAIADMLDDAVNIVEHRLARKWARTTCGSRSSLRPSVEPLAELTIQGWKMGLIKEVICTGSEKPEYRAVEVDGRLL